MELKLPSPCLLVLVGASSSGKSTWAAEHFMTNEIVSSDSLRAMVGIDENDQQASSKAFELLDTVVAERLKRRLTTIIDSTGLSRDNRAKWLSTAHANDMPAHVVLFDISPEECASRNQSRAFPLPKSVLKSQLSRFTTTVKTIAGEEFDGVHHHQAIAVVPPQIHVSSKARSTSTDRNEHSFGLMVNRFDWERESFADQFASIVKRAETAGFRDLWVMDHFRQIHQVGRPWEDIPEAYTALAFAAGVSDRIGLGALVTSVTHRNPALLGKMIATLDVLSGGRAICGLGIGWDKEEHSSYGIEYPPVRVRYEMLEDMLEMLPLLWGKGSPEFEGSHLRAASLTCYPRPIQDLIPILIGGSGEKRTLRLVAEYATACNLFGAPDTIAHKVGVLKRHCREIGRDPAEIEVTHLTSTLVATDRRSLVARVDQVRDRNTSRDQFLTANNGGTIDDVVGLFASYHGAGAHHSIISMADVSLEGSIETFGEVIETLK